jgi:hypothetical protein
LILKGLLNCTFFGHLSQAFDFPGLGAHRHGSINKVIHMLSPAAANLIKINDLSCTSEIHLNTGA